MLYLDAGSGSYLVQAIIAAVVGFSLFFKKFWVNIKNFLFKGQKRKNKNV